MVTLAAGPRIQPLHRIWKRELGEYPTGPRRAWYLGIVVAVTVVLYYQTYIAGAVATEILRDYNMSFVYFATITAIATAFGAIASFAAGIADRMGRANLVVGGTVATSLITLFGVPNAHSSLQFAIAISVVGFIEGIILVATPALVRDFSPQVGRAQAMAFWTMGPVLGSLVVSEVSSNTLDSLPRWQDQYVIAGVVGLVIAVVAFVGLRELGTEHRNQIVGALDAETEQLIAQQGLTSEQRSQNPFRQMLKLDIIGSSMGISLFLLFYYTAVVFLPVFFQTVQGFTASESNSLLNYLWISTALSMVFVGMLSDRLRVRKPFMLVGVIATVAIDSVFFAKVGNGAPSFSSIATILTFSGIWSGVVYVPWMASFTETVERRNPALMATGLGIWGWLLRLVVAAAVITLPHLVPSVTPLVQDAPEVQATLAQLETGFPQLAVEVQAHPEIFQQLGQYANSADIPNAVLDNAIRTVGTDALTQLQDPAAQAELKTLGGPAAVAVVQAKADTAAQWERWILICALGALAMLPLVFLMAGHWRPQPRTPSVLRAPAHTMDPPVGAVAVASASSSAL